jgi:hypothetical protein
LPLPLPHFDVPALVAAVVPDEPREAYLRKLLNRLFRSPRPYDDEVSIRSRVSVVEERKGRPKK